MENKNREIWVGENRLYLGEDNILRITAIGEQGEGTFRMMYDAFLKLITTVEGKVKVTIDLNKTGKMSTGARKAAAKMADNERIGKMAFFGLHPVARVIASFFMGIAQKKDMRIFKTEAEALAWLKE